MTQYPMRMKDDVSLSSVQLEWRTNRVSLLLMHYDNVQSLKIISVRD
jgi:hypothetical protein